jgi:predicted DNA-binding protein (UPF0251 family)
MTPEEETLEKIKYVLSCGNDAQAVRLIEQYGYWKEEQAKQLSIHGVSQQRELLIAKIKQIDLCYIQNTRQQERLIDGILQAINCG